jgi:hypothetical protein
MLSRNLDVTLVVPDRICDGHKHTDSNTQESETTNSLTPASTLLVDDRECREEHVQSAVNDGHVDREEQHNRFAEQ